MKYSKYFSVFRGLLFIGLAIYILFFAEGAFTFQVWQRNLFVAILIGYGIFRLVQTYRSWGSYGRVERQLKNRPNSNQKDEQA